MILILGTIRFDPAQAAEARALAREVSVHSLEEEGCLHYAIGLDAGHADRLQVAEFWRDAAAFQAHVDSPHVQAFRAALAKVRVHERAIQRWNIHEAQPL
jgi:quinol monooxygenase YgiN